MAERRGLGWRVGRHRVADLLPPLWHLDVGADGGHPARHPTARLGRVLGGRQSSSIHPVQLKITQRGWRRLEIESQEEEEQVEEVGSGGGGG